ncbi:MAG: hypothetical protein JWO11_3523 [Nocardioides sp.]|nr:hypothetical protein [Nocardioides sp.]
MGSIVVLEANRLLDASLSTTAYTAPTTGMNLALVTVIGTNAAAGTEVTGGSYARQPIAFGAASAGSAANSGVITFAAMPAVTVVGIDIYDRNGTPRRAWWGTITNKTLGSGDTLSFAIGSITIGMT